MIKAYLSTFTFILALIFDPNGAPIKLPMTVNSVGHKGIVPPEILPTTPPMAEIKTIASEEAMVVRAGMWSRVSMTGIRIKAPPAPTIPETIPTIKEDIIAIKVLN